MIKVTSFKIEKRNEDGTREVVASLLADSANDANAIKDDGSKVSGLKDGDKLVLGSTCLCATGDFGMIDSTGKWNF